MPEPLALTSALPPQPRRAAVAPPGAGTAAAAPAARTPHAALVMSGLALAMSAGALAVALRPAAPPVVATPPVALPAIAAPEAPPPVARAALDPGLLALAGLELLLPQLARPAPFPRALAVAIALAEPEPAIAEALAPLAEAARLGAPLLRQLAESFGAAADAAVLAEMGYGAESGRVARLMASTMRVGAGLGSAGTPALAATAQAEQALARGDLAGAAAAIDELEGPVAEAMAPWRRAAARRLAADAAAARLAELAAARLAAPAAGALADPTEARPLRTAGTTEAGR